MNAGSIHSPIFTWIVAFAVVVVSEYVLSNTEKSCCAEQTVPANAQDVIDDALTRIHEGSKGVDEGFKILQRLNLNGECPDEILALVHSDSPDRFRIHSWLRVLFENGLTISGQRLVAEYEKADVAAKVALCDFAALQTGRRSDDTEFGRKSTQPKPLDDLTVELLVRALNDQSWSTRIAAANAIRFAGIPDERFTLPLLNGIDNKFADVSQAASLAAAELEFRQAGPLILKRLERQIADSESYADLDGWVTALRILRYQPAISLLRRIATPFDQSDSLSIEYSAGNTEFGCEATLAEAILDIENQPNRAQAILQMAEDRTLAGNVRAVALHMFDDCNDSDSKFFRPDIEPADLDQLKKYYDPEILQRLVALTDEPLPISKNGDLSSLHRLAIEVAARKFAPDSYYNVQRLRLLGTPLVDAPESPDEPQLLIDPNVVYPENLRLVRKKFLTKLETSLSGEDGPLALEALAVACPEERTIQQCLDIATDSKQNPKLRVVAANLLTWQPFLLEMDNSGFTGRYGPNASAEVAIKLIPLLELHMIMEDWRYQDCITGLFTALLGYSDANITPEEQAARKEVLPLLLELKKGPHREAAEKVLESLNIVN